MALSINSFSFFGEVSSIPDACICHRNGILCQISEYRMNGAAYSYIIPACVPDDGANVPCLLCGYRLVSLPFLLLASFLFWLVCLYNL